jgi:hypothetical protein
MYGAAAATPPGVIVSTFLTAQLAAERVRDLHHVAARSRLAALASCCRTGAVRRGIEALSSVAHQARLRLQPSARPVCCDVL